MSLLISVPTNIYFIVLILTVIQVAENTTMETLEAREVRAFRKDFHFSFITELTTTKITTISLLKSGHVILLGSYATLGIYFVLQCLGVFPELR